MWDIFIRALSPKGADRAAQRWLDSIDPLAKVGSRHHIVPRFVLAKFAKNDQLRVRDRITGKSSIRSINDLAVRDYYTAVTVDQKLDSRLEDILSEIEGRAASIVRAFIDAGAFSRPRWPTDDERFAIDTFVSAQFVRGMRARRSLELISDFSVKLLNQDRLTDDDIKNSDFVPHPNDHLKMFPQIAEKAHENLTRRPLTFVTLDRPLLIIGDEPVMLNGEADAAGHDHYHSRSAPVVSGAAGGMRPAVGIETASSVVMPVAPNAFLLFGSPSDNPARPRIRVAGGEAAAMARELNSLAIASSVDWVSAHPDHETFGSMAMPPPTPLLLIHDGDSAMSERINTNKIRRPINRLRASDVSREQIEADGWQGPGDVAR